MTFAACVLTNEYVPRIMVNPKTIEYQTRKVSCRPPIGLWGMKKATTIKTPVRKVIPKGTPLRISPPEPLFYVEAAQYCFKPLHSFYPTANQFTTFRNQFEAAPMPAFPKRKPTLPKMAPPIKRPTVIALAMSSAFKLPSITGSLER